jgi:CheY-like chemotaxis protein/anti-sigma regulatory factor (Ser/Thr protein kinase)
LSHALGRMLGAKGYSVVQTGDGTRALEKLARQQFDLILLDIGLPGTNGLDVLEQLRERGAAPRVVVMTADDTPETLLRAVRDRAFEYVTKPVPPKDIVALVERALKAPSAAAPIEVISAAPEWVELLVPCARDVAERLQGFMQRLKADLPEEVRESVGQAFRELLLNAIEWGGQLDPSRKVRISYLRARRMLLYRIADPGPGFSFKKLAHAAVNNPVDNPVKHTKERERKGLRPGGFGILMVRAMVDELIYNEAQNEVVFVKYLD